MLQDYRVTGRELDPRANTILQDCWFSGRELDTRANTMLQDYNESPVEKWIHDIIQYCKTSDSPVEN